ncbi:hypothetical protein N7448_011199 [Penicillium atrosanguineum]|nr:hypothetical protein N7448_011199 [Penicillium atrosanguineum]
MNEIPSISLESAVHACKSWAIELRLFVSVHFQVLTAKVFFESSNKGLLWSQHAHMAHRQEAVPHESLFDSLMAR